jgi:hypothetical protein
MPIGHRVGGGDGADQHLIITPEEFDRVVAGLSIESCSLVIAVDFTKSNNQGPAPPLHFSPVVPGDFLAQPYMAALRAVGNSLNRDSVDDDKRYPAYAFGNDTSKSTGLTAFRAPDAAGREQECRGLTGVGTSVLLRYLSLVRTISDESIEYDKAAGNKVVLSGGTSFAPAIYRACEHIREQEGCYHILLIITDGVPGTPEDREETRAAIAFASRSFPLSILIVGVGPGEVGKGFSEMKVLDDACDGGRDIVRGLALTHRLAEPIFS